MSTKQKGVLMTSEQEKEQAKATLIVKTIFFTASQNSFELKYCFTKMADLSLNCNLPHSDINCGHLLSAKWNQNGTKLNEMKPIETKQTQMKRNQKIRTKQNQRNEIKHARLKISYN